MNNLQSNFAQILEFAAKENIPIQKPRAIIREYLQSLAITALYSTSGDADKLIFVGGTSLRLLRGIDRFSEDLDFDNLGLSGEHIDKLMHLLEEKFRRENIEAELHRIHKGEKNYYEFRFPHLLYGLKVTTNDKEKLMIKVDYANSWKGHKPEVVLFSRYGLLERVITNPIHHLLVQKLASYVQRRQTQPRDIYDVVWLYSQGARFDTEFARANGMSDIVRQARVKFADEGVGKTLEARLRPFLFVEDNIKRLQLFPDVLAHLT